MDNERREQRESLQAQLARAEGNAEKFRLLGDQERYLQWYFLSESLGLQLDALPRPGQRAAR
jgi:hypothetical protein